MDRTDADQQAAPDFEDPVVVADDAEDSDELEAQLIAEYGLDELGEEEQAEEEGDAADDGDPDGGDSAPPEADPDAQPSDDPAEPPAEEDDPEALDPAAEAGAAPAAEAEPAAGEGGAPDDEITTWSFQTDGRTVEVPGSMVFTAQMPDGTRQKMVTMPLSTVNRHLRPYLADRGAFRRTQMEFMRGQAALEQQIQSHPNILEAQKVVGVLDTLLETLESKGEDEALELLTKFREQRDEWRRDAEIRSRDEQIAAMRKVAPPPDEVLDQLEAEEREEALQATLSDTVTSLFSEDEFKALSPYIPADEFISELREHVDKVFFIADLANATPEDRAAAEARGISDGDVVINRDYVRRRLRTELTRAERVRKSVEQRREVEQRNKERRGAKPPRTNGQQPAAAPAAPAAQDNGATDYEKWKAEYLGDVGGPQIID